VAAALYLLLNAAFFQTLPIDRIAASNLVPATSWRRCSARAVTLVAGLPCSWCWRRSTAMCLSRRA